MFSNCGPSPTIWQLQHHLKLVRNAGSQVSPQSRNPGAEAQQCDGAKVWEPLVSRKNIHIYIGRKSGRARARAFYCLNIYIDSHFVPPLQLDFFHVKIRNDLNLPS